MLEAWVYILRCADGSYYVGSHRGWDVQARVHEHNLGSNPKAYTARRLPVVLVWSEHHDRVTDAIAAERRLKGWSRAKKEALIRGDIEELRRLSRGRPRPSSGSG
jgi:putative endonuclease